MSLYSFLADLVVVVHALYVGGVVFGLLLIWIGLFCRWQWVRSFWFRAVHLLLIGVVVVESILGLVCPLTAWEDALREKAGEPVQQGTFIGRMAHDLIFYQASGWVFVTAYYVSGLPFWRRLFLRRPGGLDGGRPCCGGAVNGTCRARLTREHGLQCQRAAATAISFRRAGLDRVEVLFGLGILRVDLEGLAKLRDRLGGPSLRCQDHP